MPKETFFNLDEEKQQKIFDAAVLEFTEHQLHKARVSHIIQHAQIPRGSFYQYFEDLDDLYYYVIDRVFDNILMQGREQVALTNDFFDFIERTFVVDLDMYMNDERYRFIMNVQKGIGSNVEYLEHHNTKRHEYILEIMDQLDLSHFVSMNDEEKIQLYEFIQNIKRMSIQKALVSHADKEEAVALLRWHLNILKTGIMKKTE